MADKSISELVAATAVGSTDLFVLEQTGTAKKLTAQILENWLVSFADGHGGIQTVVKTGTSGLVDTYTITYADTTTSMFAVTNGKAISSVTQYWAVSTSGSTVPPSWSTTRQTMTPTNKYLWSYMTFTYNDGTTSDTTKSVVGVYGDTGQAWYVWIKYAAINPTSDSDMGDVPDNWIGIYSGTSSTAPTHYTDYSWFMYKGEQGDTGDAAEIISQSVTYLEGSSGTVVPSGSWTQNVPSVTPGNFLWTRTVLVFNDGTTTTAYSVSRYGIDGSGAVSTVNDVSPDPNGNVALTATNVPTSDNQSIQAHITAAEDDIDDLQTDFTKTGVARLVGKKIAIYGDSWATANYGSLGKAYIESITGETVHAVGTGSATMAQIYSSFDNYNADIYIIEGGLNDASLSTGATSFTAAIDSILAAIKAVNADAEIYFVTPPAIKTSNQRSYLFPLEFYRIGIWNCSSFKNFGVINGLKWFDIELSSDMVHPLLTQADKIGKHIIAAISNFGDEETHTSEYTTLKRTDGYMRLEADSGQLYLVAFSARFQATQANRYVGNISPVQLDTVFGSSALAIINAATGNVGQFSYGSTTPNEFTLYSAGLAVGNNMYTDVIKMPIKVVAWENPYL